MSENAVKAELTACIEACEECLHQYQHRAVECINEGMADCTLLDLGCADACAAALNAMARESAHHGDFCALCAHLCEACATECEKHASKHGHCRRCAAECKKHATEAHA
ncbi:MAG: four-helix bundle copper-binding protein [Isosphaera sp.]|nr:four-helix bundle copper-binding protein [Isosphaera sp.]